MVALTECSIMPELLGAPRPAAWEPVRRLAEAALEGQELPTTRHEDWKYTDLKSLRETAFVPGQHRAVDIKERLLPEARGTRLVFVNGHFFSRRSSIRRTPFAPPCQCILPLSPLQAQNTASALMSNRCITSTHSRGAVPSPRVKNKTRTWPPA